MSKNDLDDWRARSDEARVAKENITFFLMDYCSNVRLSAAGNPNLNELQREIALIDIDGAVRAAAAKNVKNTARLELLMDDEDSRVRAAVVGNPYTDISIVEKAISDKSWIVRVAAEKKLGLDGRIRKSRVAESELY